MYDCEICGDSGQERRFIGGYMATLCTKHNNDIHRWITIGQQTLYTKYWREKARYAASVQAGVCDMAANYVENVIELEAKLYRVCESWVAAKKENNAHTV